MGPNQLITIEPLAANPVTRLVGLAVVAGEASRAHDRSGQVGRRMPW